MILKLTTMLLLLNVAELAAQNFEYRLLATNRTSSMEKELNEAAKLGFRLETIAGGESKFGGQEVVVGLSRIPGDATQRFEYKLLATNKTSTMQRELQVAADEGYIYRGQTSFARAFAGKELVLVLERDNTNQGAKAEYRVLATSRTSTMQKELADAGLEGFALLGMIVADTAFGGDELIAIVSRFP
jgi:hypothetical protein